MKRLLFSERTSDAESTSLCGERLASLIDGGAPGFVCLYGDLGSGKTEFCRGIGRYFSPGSTVRSPSYTIVNEYRKGRRPVFHFDLYRLSGNELEGTGFYDYPEDGIFCIEWADLFPDALPAVRCEVYIRKTGPDNPDERIIEAFCVSPADIQKGRNT